ncbi:MAG TPA: hypothetical protein VFG14_01455 [Chthoniobacteraceae bacterium]|nr:hypothetical protein [Chthoniobacteraceae bacterium]
MRVEASWDELAETTQSATARPGKPALARTAGLFSQGRAEEACGQGIFDGRFIGRVGGLFREAATADPAIRWMIGEVQRLI